MSFIKPITFLRNTTELSETCHSTDEPIFITRNGENDLVIMSDTCFDLMFKKKYHDDINIEAPLSSTFARMGNPYIRVGAHPLKTVIADVKHNVSEIEKELILASNNKEKIVVFPELSLTGYTAGDLFFNDGIIDEVLKGLKSLKAFSLNVDILFAVGAPIRIDSKLYNVAIFFKDGRILGIIPKTYLPNYREYQEKRYFSSGRHLNLDVNLFDELVPVSTKLIFSCINNSLIKVGAEICEDLWAPISPSSFSATSGASLILNLSASNEIVGKKQIREDLVKNTSKRLLCSYVYVSCGSGESTQDLVYSGAALIYENGEQKAKNELFTNDSIYADIDLELINKERMINTTFEVNRTHKEIFFELKEDSTFDGAIEKYPFIPADHLLDDILKIQIEGLKTRIQKLNSKLVLGLSGGLDSTLALIVSYEALKLLERPVEDLYAFSMPAMGSTSRTRNNVERLAALFGVSFKTIDITNAVKLHLKDIEHEEGKFDNTYENAQARERTQILMDKANQLGGIVVGTGDLSESCLGWSTYNGDHMSNYSVNSSIPKTLVKKLIEHYAMKHLTLKEVLFDILDTPISPELIKSDKDEISQKTEDLIGPYALHDFFIYYSLLYGYKPKRIFSLAKCAFNETYSDKKILETLKIFYKRFITMQFKRSCLPDGPKATAVSISPRGDLRMPSDASYSLFLKELDEIDI